MGSCTVTPIETTKACSGKCLGLCSKTAKSIIAAACGGRVCLFEKKDGQLIGLENHTVFSSMESVVELLTNASTKCGIDQLILVGSGNDMAWMHTLLPHEISKHIVAEIEYPLVPAWFKPDGHGLVSALENLMR